MSLADYLFDLTNEALATCSAQQQTIYRLVHGVTETGTNTPQSLESVAKTLGLSRSSARWHLAMSELAIYKHLAQTLIRERQETETFDLPGTPTYADFSTYGMSVRQRDRQTSSTVELGEGSAEVLRAARLGRPETRHERYRQIHERYTRREPDA